MQKITIKVSHLHHICPFQKFHLVLNEVKWHPVQWYERFVIISKHILTICILSNSIFQLPEAFSWHPKKEKQSSQGLSRYPLVLFEQTVYRLLPSSPDIQGVVIEHISTPFVSQMIASPLSTF